MTDRINAITLFVCMAVERHWAGAAITPKGYTILTDEVEAWFAPPPFPTFFGPDNCWYNSHRINLNAVGTQSGDVHILISKAKSGGTKELIAAIPYGHSVKTGNTYQMQPGFLRLDDPELVKLGVRFGEFKCLEVDL